MPRSLTKAQRRELQKVTRKAAEAEKRVEALQSQKRATQEEVRRLCNHLGARNCAETVWTVPHAAFEIAPEQMRGHQHFEIQVTGYNR